MCTHLHTRTHAEAGTGGFKLNPDYHMLSTGCSRAGTGCAGLAPGQLKEETLNHQLSPSSRGRGRKGQRRPWTRGKAWHGTARSVCLATRGHSSRAWRSGERAGLAG